MQESNNLRIDLMRISSIEIPKGKKIVISSQNDYSNFNGSSFKTLTEDFLD